MVGESAADFADLPVDPVDQVGWGHLTHRLGLRLLPGLRAGLHDADGRCDLGQHRCPHGWRGDVCHRADGVPLSGALAAQWGALTVSWGSGLPYEVTNPPKRGAPIITWLLFRV